MSLESAGAGEGTEDFDGSGDGEEGVADGEEAGAVSEEGGAGGDEIGLRGALAGEDSGTDIGVGEETGEGASAASSGAGPGEICVGSADTATSRDNRAAITHNRNFSIGEKLS
ncbi:hypothetical protein SAY86_023030 [Trapa natans]|uniref:Uncharacterized protein n=1 Tax=Trapa natans TaxID=22666 RepID=A0AAN7MA15_TRANT|nr:hypothetical protein SAY86_023030 [Trapa natans]